MLKRIFRPGRALIESMENRILVGIASFMATIVILGWVAINESGRMQAFDRQFNARSTERGAELFVSACATCHGPEGQGSPRAPALNNPQLFGHDYFPELTVQVVALQQQKGSLEAEEIALNDEVGTQPSAARVAEIQARFAVISDERDQINGEIDALRVEMEAQLPVSVLNAGYNPLEFDRLDQTAWGGGLQSFIISTVTSGRPVSSAYWPQPMPAWGQLSGGSLRTDTIQDVARYIMNWEREWTLDDLAAVNQFAVEPCNPSSPDCGGGVVDATDGAFEILPPTEFAGTNVPQVVASIAEIEGDAAAGETLYAAQGCAGCHLGGAVGPDVVGTFTRVENQRLIALSGYSAGQYLVESILAPNAYVVPGFTDGLMPATFGSTLTVQQVADLVAYLETQTE